MAEQQTPPSTPVAEEPDPLGLRWKHDTALAKGPTPPPYRPVVWSCCGTPHPGPHLDICPALPVSNVCMSCGSNRPEGGRKQAVTPSGLPLRGLWVCADDQACWDAKMDRQMASTAPSVSEAGDA